MRKLPVLIIVIATSAAVAIPALASTTRTIRVGDDFFVRAGSPPTVNVKRNTTVRWNFVGSSPHNVTVTSGPVKFKSSTRTSGRYSRKMTRVGTYRIVCTIHDGQRMTLRVRR